MKPATALTALLFVTAILACPLRAAAQSNPFPTGGGNASQVLPGAESSSAPSANPLLGMVSALSGRSLLPGFATAWTLDGMFATALRPAPVSHLARLAPVRRGAPARASR